MESDKQTRRLQLSGGSTFTTSLPKAWIEELGLKAGDNIAVTKNPNMSITITADIDFPDTGYAATKISQKNSYESIRRRIIAMYLAGYRSIRITSKGVRLESGQAAMIREFVRSTMIGTEIVESDSESILIQILAKLPEIPFDVALKRMHEMTVSMHKKAVGILATADRKQAEETARMDDEIDRFSLYMLRNLTMAVQSAPMLSEMGLERPADCLMYRTVISRIERIADHGALIAKRVKFLEEPVGGVVLKKLTVLSRDALALFERSIESLIKSDYYMAENVAEDIPDVVQRQERMMLGMGDSGNSSVIKFVLDDIRRTAEYSGDIAEVVMDKNIQGILE